MTLLNKKNRRVVYTLKDIIENDYPELYETINSCFLELESWQKTSLKLLPKYKKQVVDNKDNRKSMDSQVGLMNYLKLRLLYGFAQHIWKQINDHCHNLASYVNEHNEDGVAKEETPLFDLMKRFSQISIKGIAEDEVDGFFRLCRVVESFNYGEDVLNVLERFDKENRHSIYYSFGDILGAIDRDGLQDNGLWKMVLEGIEPTKPNVCGLMESEWDNKPVRVY